MSIVSFLRFARFTPEQLGMHASSVLVWNIIEICMLCFTFYILNVQSKLRTLDLIAYCGYKYVGMIAALSSYLLTHSLLVYRCALLYVSLSLSYFLVSLSSSCPSSRLRLSFDLGEMSSSTNLARDWRSTSVWREWEQASYLFIASDCSNPTIVHLVFNSTFNCYLKQSLTLSTKKKKKKHQQTSE